jgi:nitrogen fixation protein NifB
MSSTNPALEKLSLVHPCFATGARNHKGRVHLPVSLDCNIACRFCTRALEPAGPDLPGRAAVVLQPEEAVEVVRRALERAPEITVAGIAGPGDPLATPHAVETLRLIRQAFPHLLLCLSTNGMGLPDYADALLAVGLDTLTVTVNAISPETLAKLCAWVEYRGKRLPGEEGAAHLIQNQMKGIRRMAASGTMIKINTVLVPPVNGAEIADIARAVQEAGASLHNIIPLIPQGAFEGWEVPSCDEINTARAAAQAYLPVFRHCQHCRADAAGIPGGRDISEGLYPRRIHLEETFSHG